MNIEKLARKAIDILKTKQDNFPKTGIVAGGSLGNIIWEMISGNIAVVNDIDVFVFENKFDKDTIGGEMTTTNERKKIFYRSQEKIYWKDYTGFCEGSKTKDFYLIERTENIGLYNFVYYSATQDSPELVVDSFDINCTQIAYHIDTDSFYWTKEFEEFLNTGELKLTNLGSPHHSAIRITKKRDDLNAKLDETEIKIAAFTISRHLNGVTRRYFSDKYEKIFNKYETELSKYFKIVKEKEISTIIKESKGIDIGIFTLETVVNPSSIFQDELNDDIKNKLWHANDFLFYFRNIQHDDLLSKVWSKVQPLFTYTNYVDIEPSDEDLNLLKRIIENIPNSIKNLQGYRLSQQIKFVKKLLEEFKEDPSVAFALLDNKRIEPDTEFDIQTKLLLELSVRVEIVSNKYDINKILNIQTKTDFDDKCLPF
jgi:hypothetical protein